MKKLLLITVLLSATSVFAVVTPLREVPGQVWACADEIKQHNCTGVNVACVLTCPAPGGVMNSFAGLINISIPATESTNEPYEVTAEEEVFCSQKCNCGSQTFQFTNCVPFGAGFTCMGVSQKSCTQGLACSDLLPIWIMSPLEYELCYH